MDANKLPPEDRRKLNEWKKKLKDQWDYRRKLVIFEGSDGVLITPTTTTSTAPPVVSTLRPNTTHFSPVVTVNTTDSATPKTGGLAAGDTQQLLKIVGITCVSLLAVILIALVVIRVCRRSGSKRDQNISIRRPLNSPEPEDHIYAEIEPIQLVRSDGASGSSATVPLPSKKEKKRRRGVSSFRALSTRLHRLFNVDQAQDNQSVFYNRSEERPVVRNEPPETPHRNGSPTKRGKGKGVKRFESQSRRPLLDGDSQISTSSSADASMRDNIYNPLLRNNEARASGPYDHLDLIRTRSGEDSDADSVPPASPHDYFVLEATASKENPLLSSEITMGTIAEDENGDLEKPRDYFVLESETAKSADTKDYECETPVTSKHDYFTLEPQPDPHRAESPEQLQAEDSANPSPAASSPKNKLDDLEKECTLGEAKKAGKTKPSVTPRMTSPSSESKTISDPNRDKNVIDMSPVNGTSERKGNNYVHIQGMSPMPSRTGVKEETDTTSAISGKKDEDYDLYKLGEAPVPPSPDADEYLEPVEAKKELYIDVFPTPPPRTTSVQPSSPSRQQTSPVPQHASLEKQHEHHGQGSPARHQRSPVKRLESPGKQQMSFARESPTRHRDSPSPKQGHKSEQKSPVKRLESPGKQQVSAARESHTRHRDLSSPKQDDRSPIKRLDSPIRQLPSPVNRHGSPARQQASPVKEGLTVKKQGSSEKSQEKQNIHVETAI